MYRDWVKNIALLGCLMTLWQMPFAQQLSTRISANTLAQGELLKVWYEVENASMKEFREPQFLDWRVVEGPALESTITHTGGQSKSKQAYVFFLEPLRTGSLVVPSAMAHLADGWTSSKAVIVTVVKGNASQGNSNTPQNNAPVASPRISEDFEAMLLREGEVPQQKIASNLFVEVESSKKEIYDGEPVVVSYLLYCRVDLEARLVKRPTFTGCSVIDLPIAPEGSYSYRQKNGRNFKVYEIRKVQLYPLQSGQIALEPLEIDATVRFTRLPSSPAAYEDYNLYNPANQLRVPYTIRSQRQSILVKPIPDSRDVPVGRFSVTTVVAANMLKIGEPTTFQLVVEGKGRWMLMNPPTIAWPNGLQVFASGTTEQLDSNSVPIAGKRTYSFPISASTPGEYTIPSVTMAWFDPETESFGSSQSNPITLKVSNQAYAIPTEPGKEITKYLPATDWMQWWPIMLLAGMISVWLFAVWKRRQLVAKLNRKDEVPTAQETETPTWSVATPVVKAGSPTAHSRSTRSSATVPAAPASTAQHFFRLALFGVQNALTRNESLWQRNDATRQEAQRYIDYCNTWLYSPVQPEFDEETESGKLEDLLQRLNSGT